MVLSQDELGEIASGMLFSPDSSGVVSNAKAAASSLQPNDTAEDQAAAGRVTGYIAEYSAPAGGSTGIITVNSEVQLFESSESAKEAMGRFAADLAEIEGQDLGGFTILDVEAFAVAGIGDAAGGIRFEAAVQGQSNPIVGTIAYFVLGPIAGSTFILRADDSPAAADAERILRALEARVARIVAAERVWGTDIQPGEP